MVWVNFFESKIILFYTFCRAGHVHLALCGLFCLLHCIELWPHTNSVSPRSLLSWQFVADQADPLPHLFICQAPGEHSLSLRFYRCYLLVDGAVSGESDEVAILPSGFDQIAVLPRLGAILFVPLSS